MNASPASPLSEPRGLERQVVVPGRLAVTFCPATQFRSVVSLCQIAAGDVVAPFGAMSTASTASQMSVQVGPDQHILLDPEYLSRINHGCDPTVIFDLPAGVVRAAREIHPGDELTYFYPSTEWSMAVPFACHCGAPGCLKTIRGAAHLPDTVLARYHLSPHVLALQSARRATGGP